MDLDSITSRAAAVVADFVMQVPVIIGSRNVLNAEGLISAVLRLADFPIPIACSLKGRCSHVEVVTSTDGIGSRQSADVGRRYVHR